MPLDYNGRQIDGVVENVLSLGNLRTKWEAFGWLVMETNGNDIEKLIQTMKEAKANCRKQKPVVILMKTEMGMGVDFMMGTHKWHGSPPNKEQTEKALAQLEETLGDY